MVDEQWVSEREMAEDLGWSKTLDHIELVQKHSRRDQSVPRIYIPMFCSLGPALPERSRSARVWLPPMLGGCVIRHAYANPLPMGHFVRKNQYDDEYEYYVIISEKGQREMEETHEEIKRKIGKLEARFDWT